MTAYIANHQKKNRIFRKREEELRHAIRHGFSVEKTHKAAERLRDAKYAVFKARFSQNSVLPAHLFSIDSVAGREPLVKKWISMTTEEIVVEYSKGES